MSIYLYGIRCKQSQSIPPIKGVLDAKAVTTMPCNGIEAIVSSVEASKASMKEIQRKAKEDPPWIARNAICHEKVLEAAMGRKKMIPVIPMKFGTVFASRVSLQEMLRKHCDSFSQSLKSLTGFREWGVSIYVDTDRERIDLIDSHPDLRSEKEKGKSLPKGADYFHDMELTAHANALLDEHLSIRSQECFESLKKCAVQSIEKAPLPQAFISLAGDTEEKEKQMILNSAYLIPIQKEGEFRDSVTHLTHSYPTCIFRLTGPWPPYHFVSSQTNS